MAASSSSDTMRAVVFKRPYEVTVEERPVPKIQDEGDIVVKVGYTALCGRYVFVLFVRG
jgi:threonine dehydrogenase-like Zn-dependent dehydrogenase